MKQAPIAWQKCRHYPNSFSILHCQLYIVTYFCTVSDPNINIKNRKASFEYHFLDTYTAGIVLTGTEIKSVRNGQVSLAEGYCTVVGGEVYVRNINIAEYAMGTYNNHAPKRDRKLLLNKNEIKKIIVKTKDKGVTMIPLRMFINERGFAKLEFTIAKGKKIYDKREDIKKRDTDRDLRRTE